jgi:DNA-binding transcriptional LysR family regulator
MEIDQIKTFLAVATFGGFHRAAEALNVSQPAVSARIKALEESMGATLFARSRSGLTLSEAGRILRPYAEELLRAASRAAQAVHELKPAGAGPLRIAAAHSISVYFLPDVLKRFKRAHPKVVIAIRPGQSKEVLEMVLKDEAEIGLARSLNHPEVETLRLREDPLLLVGHPKQGPTSARRARLDQVANWPLVFYERGSSDWTLTHSLFRRAGLVPNVALEVETAKRIVDRGRGMAFLPQLAVGQEIRSGKLAMVKLIDAEPLGRSIDVIHPRHRPLRVEAQAFLQVIRDAAKETSIVARSSHRTESSRRRRRSSR